MYCNKIVERSTLMFIFSCIFVCLLFALTFVGLHAFCGFCVVYFRNSCLFVVVFVREMCVVAREKRGIVADYTTEI